MASQFNRVSDGSEKVRQLEIGDARAMNSKKRRSTASRQGLLYIAWALAYQMPALDLQEQFAQMPHDGFVYYAPTRPLVAENWADCLVTIAGQFLFTASPLTLREAEAGHLVPATMRTRLHLALGYDEDVCVETPMVWCPDRFGGQNEGTLLAWYEDAGLWGATHFASPAGKQGTALAQTRAPLVEDLLRHHLIPCPHLRERVQSLPGMESIAPLFLAQEEACEPLTPFLHYLRSHPVQAASNREPWYVLAGRSPEWLITLLHADRRADFQYASSFLPAVTRLLWSLCDDARDLEASADQAAWIQAHESDDGEYEAQVRQAQALKALFADTYPALLEAFEQTAIGMEKMFSVGLG